MTPDTPDSGGEGGGATRASPTVSRALAVLDLFDATHTIWTAESICAVLGCSLPTGYRYIRELVASGLLRRHSGGFALGPRIILLDYVMRQADPLLEASAPVMRDLAQRTTCDCVLTAVYGDQILDVHREFGASPLALAYGRGRPRPLFVGAAPKVILAAQPTAWIRKLYEAHAAEAEAAGMGGDWSVFKANLTAVRKRGFYVSRGELEPDVYAIAAPIRATATEPAAALAVVTTAERFAILNELHVVRLVIGATVQIAQTLARG
jgi:DNA-binding IclR family transcriptional regulator